ncbi:MAG: metallophosphoesterase family protein [Candidatus Heimdallarchaeaceae archaeon]
MVKILHLADTHLAHRRFHNVRDDWKESNRITWIEADFANSFHEALEIAKSSNCDYLVHAGDLFDVPVARNLSAPTEYSRAFVINELHEFFKETEYKVPLILIDGNHGTYLYRNYSTLEFIQAAFPNQVFLATNYDLKKAILENKPLKVEFEDVNFYLFPYFKFGRSTTHDRKYDEWIRENQTPDPSKINIAVAHGMTKGDDLHDFLFQFPYDYVALGHDHHQKRISKNMWQAGSTEKYTFTERNQKKGVLEVIVEKGKDPIVTPKLLSKNREMKQFKIKVDTNMSSRDFEAKVRELLEPFHTPFDGETAVRFKIMIEGNIELSRWWNMEDLLTNIQNEVFAEDYNILEFRWDASNVSKTAPTQLTKGAKISLYLIEDPVKDFERYIRSKNIEDQELAMQYIEVGADLIKEVFSDGSVHEESENLEGN